MIPLATWDIRFRQRHESVPITPHAIVASVQYAPSGLSATRTMPKVLSISPVTSRLRPLDRKRSIRRRALNRIVAG
jgi:hypothetical protein